VLKELRWPAEIDWEGSYRYPLGPLFSTNFIQEQFFPPFCFQIWITLCDLYKTRVDLQGDRLMEQKQLAFSQDLGKVRDNRRSISQQGNFLLWNLVWALAMKVSNRLEEEDTRFDRIDNLKHLENFLFGVEYESLIIISVVSFFLIHFYSLLTWAFSHSWERALEQKLCVIN